MVSWCGECYHNDCPRRIDGVEGVSWCHGVENVITMTALSRQIDGVEGVSWCGECYYNDCLVQTHRWGRGSVMVWRMLLQ